MRNFTVRLSDEEKARRKRVQQIEKVVGTIAVVLFLVVGFAASFWWHEKVYGDWTCMFSDCIRIVDVDDRN